MLIHYECQICGGPLMHPHEIKEGFHERCYTNWKELNHTMR